MVSFGLRLRGVSHATAHSALNRSKTHVKATLLHTAENETRDA